MKSKFLQQLLSFFSFKSKSAIHRKDDIVNLLGFKPSDFKIYQTALRHSSVIYTQKVELESNERLEFLGDSVLDLIASEKLYDKFPDKNEGELTKLRVKMVNRNFLNERAMAIGIPSLLHQYVGKKKDLLKLKHNLYGNALEAIIGAVYLESGLDRCRVFVEEKVFESDKTLNKVLMKDKDFKSKLMSWSQKENRCIEFVDAPSVSAKSFRVFIEVDGQILGEGSGKRKKIAHQKAAENCIEELKERNLWQD